MKLPKIAEVFNAKQLTDEFKKIVYDVANHDVKSMDSFITLYTIVELFS